MALTRGRSMFPWLTLLLTGEEPLWFNWAISMASNVAPANATVVTLRTPDARISEVVIRKCGAETAVSATVRVQRYKGQTVFGRVKQLQCAKRLRSRLALTQRDSGV